MHPPSSSPKPWSLLAAIVLPALSVAHSEAQSLAIEGFDVGPGQVAVDYASDPSLYYILDRLALPDGPSTGVAIGLGAPGTARLIDTTAPGDSAFYRIRGYSRQNPIDSDGDGMDDVYELQRANLNPLSSADAATPRPFDGTTTTELDAYRNNYVVGRGRHDITGQAAGGGMMGYAEGAQKTTGIHDRQWARAFIVRDRTPPHRRVVFVIADCGQLFHSVTQGVFDKIRADDELKDYYSFRNIILSATHTHGGAGGYAHHFLFNATIGGFSWRTYDAIVHGIYMSIKKAHRDLGPGEITRNIGTLDNANENRRPGAFYQNVEHVYPVLGNPFGTDNRDTDMLALRFDQQGKGAVAMFNWFPVHGVSVSKENTLITGDNKGYAAYWFERNNGARYPGNPGYDPNASTFVAGFANSNPGDLTANRRESEAVLDQSRLPAAWVKPADWPANKWPDNGASRTSDYGRASLIGGRQYEKADALFRDAADTSTKTHGPIDYRHKYVDFSAVTVNPSAIYPYNVPGVGFPVERMGLLQPFSTCVGALGFEFAKGTKDGEALPQVAVDALILAFPTDPVTAIMEICQYPKDIILTTTGVLNLTPQVLPVSILRIGDLVILGVPAEFTVTAGYRLRRTVEDTFAAQGQSVRAVLAGLANSYSGYVTTFEEYVYEDISSGIPNQGYEAASTHFGAFTLAAYQTHFAEMAQAMATGTGQPGPPVADQIPANARTDDPLVADPIPFLDTAPPPNVVAATYHEPAGCPTGQFWDVGTGDCWSCPAGYSRTVLPIVDLITGQPNNGACEEDPVYRSATQHGAPGCPVGQFFDLGTASCWSCPTGFNRSVLPIVDLITGNPSPNGCHKPASSQFTAADSQSATGGSDCPAGYVYDFILGRCYKCPTGYAKNITRAWNNAAACEREESTGADNTAGTGFFGTDCPGGYVFDFGLGRCYKCPNGWNKHLLRAWNTGNACVRTVTTSADNTAGTGGSDCPPGYVYDFILGRCYKCPTGFNKYVLRAWNDAQACEKIIPEDWTAASRFASGICGAGQFLDIGLGTCWSCPAGFARTVLFPVNGSQACEKSLAVFSAATRHGKYHCDQRDPNWFLDIGRGECWSCPPGAWRNLNPVNGGAACNLPRPFGDVRTNPAASYAKRSTASVSFWAGHPGNAFGTGVVRLTDAVPTFLEVQRRNPRGQWVNVRTDADWDTTFEWEATEGSGAATIKWIIPADAEGGTYRIKHSGYSGNLSGVSPYDGTSPEFQVTD